MTWYIQDYSAVSSAMPTDRVSCPNKWTQFGGFLWSGPFCHSLEVLERITCGQRVSFVCWVPWPVTDSNRCRWQLNHALMTTCCKIQLNVIRQFSTSFKEWKIKKTHITIYHALNDCSNAHPKIAFSLSFKNSLLDAFKCEACWTCS